MKILDRRTASDATHAAIPLRVFLCRVVRTRPRKASGIRPKQKV